MKAMNVKKWVMLALLVPLVSTALSEQKESQEQSKSDSLVFQGQGRSRNRDENAALDEAIIAAKEDAMDKAIERVLHNVKDSSLNEVAQRYIKENLAPDKCIENFEVTSKKRTETTSYVTGKATFNNKLEGTVAMLRDKMQYLGYPRLMVILDEEIIQPATFPPIPTGGMMAQIAVEQVLIKKGFRVVDKATVDDNTRKEVQAAILKGDNDTIVRLAREHGADVIISGRPARAQFVSNVDLDVVRLSGPRYTATIDIRAIDCDTARLLVAQGCNGTGFGETNLLAAREAFNKAGSEMAKKVLKDILYFWIVLERDKTIMVEIRGVAHDKAVEIAEALKEEEKWVKRHGTVVVREGVCSFPLSVEGKTTAAKVADTIRQIEKGLKVVEVTDRRVVLQKAEE